MRLLILGLVLVASAPAGALEIWLARTEDCNSCGLYERAAQMRGYGFALQYADGSGITIPILSIDKNVLAADVLAQLPPEESPESPDWHRTLTVLVMDVGRVLAAGNIAESADNNELLLPEAVMFPPAEPVRDDPALRVENPYAAFFVANWNLEYFVDVALGKRPRRAPARPIDLASPAPFALGARNVVLWGSAQMPLENALFIPTRIQEIRAALERLSLGAVRFVTLYGHGPQVEGNDTSYVEDGRLRFERAAVERDLGADAASLNSVLTSVLNGTSRTLLVQVGHSGPAGSPLWGHGLTLLPEDLAPIKSQSAGELVMISGACHSGMFAKAVQCGFFAAHPEVLAAGCQLSREAIEESDDYLRHFFRAAAQAPPARRSSRTARTTLYDAHWRAAVALEDHQIAYTTTDALIDYYFAANPERLPSTMTVGEIQSAARTLTNAEAEAAAALTRGLAADTEIALTGYIEANHAADERLADATEMSSERRNRIADLPYKLMLPLLARRIAYAALAENDAEFTLAASCERQTLQDFLGGNRAR